MSIYIFAYIFILLLQYAQINCTSVQPFTNTLGEMLQTVLGLIVFQNKNLKGQSFCIFIAHHIKRKQKIR